MSKRARICSITQVPTAPCNHCEKRIDTTKLPNLSKHQIYLWEHYEWATCKNCINIECGDPDCDHEFFITSVNLEFMEA